MNHQRRRWQYPLVNDVAVKHGCDRNGVQGKTEQPNFALYVKREDHYMVWDRVWASSMEAAEDYFRGKYPTEKRKVLRIRKGKG